METIGRCFFGSRVLRCVKCAASTARRRFSLDFVLQRGLVGPLGSSLVL